MPLSVFYCVPVSSILLSFLQQCMHIPYFILHVKICPEFFADLVLDSYFDELYEDRRRFHIDSRVYCVRAHLPLSHWVHFTVLRCICVFVFSCISLHACCIIVTWWGGPGGIEAWSDDWPSSFTVLWHCWLGHMTCKNIVPEWPILCRVRH